MKKVLGILCTIFLLSSSYAANNESNQAQEGLEDYLKALQTYFTDLGISTTDQHALLDAYKTERQKAQDAENLQGSGQLDATLGDESNNDHLSAVSISYNSVENGYTAEGKRRFWHSPKTDQDWFKFSGQQGDHVTLYGYSSSVFVSVTITLFDAALNEIESRLALPIGLELPATGTFYIRVTTRNATTSDKSYTVGLAKMPADGNYPNQDYADATVVNINQNQQMGTNSISYFGEKDWFTFNSPGNENLHVEINTASPLGDLRPLVILYDATHHEIKVGEFKNLSNHDKFFDFWISSPGQYYLLVTSGIPVPLGIGEYEIILQGAPRLSIDDPSVTEGNEGTNTAQFTVSLDKPNDTGADITFDWETSDNSAIENQDYLPANGSGSIPANAQSTIIDINIKGDYIPEPNEDFLVTLANISGAVALDDSGLCTILDDEISIDSDRNAGFPPLVVNFYSHVISNGGTWNLGNGASTPYSHPITYYKPGSWNSETRKYNVAFDKQGFDDFIEVYEPGGYGRLELVKASPAEKYGWDNAVDGDLFGYDGTTITQADETGHPWAIFQFSDASTRILQTLRLMNHTGIGHFWHQVQKFQVWISTTGTNDADFAMILEAEKTNNVSEPGFQLDWQEWAIDSVPAKYIKLVILEPAESKWIYLGEFEAWFDTELPDYEASYVQGQIDETGNSALITLYLFDQDGNPLSGKTSQDIQFFAFSDLVIQATCDLFSDPTEVKPGVYQTTLTPCTGGTKLVMASVNGTVIDKDDAGNGLELVFAESADQDQIITGPGYSDNGLAFVQGSPTYGKGDDQRNWQNAIDGDLTGFDGSTWAKGDNDPYGAAWAIFKFADDQMYSFNRISLQTDNGLADDGMNGLQTTQFEIQISTTGTDGADFIPVKTIRRVGNGEMRSYPIGKMVTAKYIMLRLLAPAWGQGGFRQIVEFSVDTNLKGGAIPAAEKEPLAAVNDEFRLGQNYPNPFNPVTTIDYNLPAASNVTLAVYDITGKKLEVLVNEFQSKGNHRIDWNAAHYPSGVYFYRISAGDIQETKRMILLK